MRGRGEVGMGLDRAHDSAFRSLHTCQYFSVNSYQRLSSLCFIHVPHLLVCLCQLLVGGFSLEETRVPFLFLSLLSYLPPTLPSSLEMVEGNGMYMLCVQILCV